MPMTRTALKAALARARALGFSESDVFRCRDHEAVGPRITGSSPASRRRASQYTAASGDEFPGCS